MTTALRRFGWIIGMAALPFTGVGFEHRSGPWRPTRASPIILWGDGGAVALTVASVTKVWILVTAWSSGITRATWKVRVPTSESAPQSATTRAMPILPAVMLKSSPAPASSTTTPATTSAPVTALAPSLGPASSTTTPAATSSPAQAPGKVKAAASSASIPAMAMWPATRPDTPPAAASSATIPAATTTPAFSLDREAPPVSSVRIPATPTSLSAKLELSAFAISTSGKLAATSSTEGGQNPGLTPTPPQWRGRRIWSAALRAGVGQLSP